MPSGDSSETGKKLLSKARSKLASVNIPKSSGPSICAELSKVYIAPTVNWSPVFLRLQTEKLNKLDSAQTKKFRGHFGLALSDSTIGLFRPIDCFGGGLTSFTATDLCGNARELEADLSNHADCGIALRSSLKLTR